MCVCVCVCVYIYIAQDTTLYITTAMIANCEVYHVIFSSFPKLDILVCYI